MSRGGRRSGAGRPRGATGPGPRRVAVSVRLAEPTAAELAQLAGTATAGLQVLAEAWAQLAPSERAAMVPQRQPA